MNFNLVELRSVEVVGCRAGAPPPPKGSLHSLPSGLTPTPPPCPRGARTLGGDAARRARAQARGGSEATEHASTGVSTAGVGTKPRN